MSRNGWTTVEVVVIAAVFVILGAVTIGAIGGCEQRGSSSDEDIARQTERAMREANAQVGMPAIKNYQEKKLAKMIYELRDREDLVCYAYLKSLDGKAVFLGKCIGYGLPYCVQFSNPEKLVSDRFGSAAGWYVGPIPQPEPNGLFMPQSLAGRG